MQFHGFEVHVLPAQPQYLVLAAPGQHQEPDRRRRMRRDATARLCLVERTPKPAELGRRQEPLPRLLAVLHPARARVAPLGHQPPGLRHVEHTRQQVQRPVRHHRRRPHRVVQLPHVLPPDATKRQLPQRRHDALLRPSAVRPHRARLAVLLRVLLEIPLGKLGDRRSVRALRRQRLRHRLLARLDPRDDQRRPPPRLLRRDHPVPAHRKPPPRAPRAGLHHVVFRAGRVDPDAEARLLRVPEHRVLVHLQRLHRAP